MPSLVRLDLDGLLAHLAAVCSRHSEVLAAYVFGSALDRMRPNSNFDVGIVLHPNRERPGGHWGCEGPLEADLGWYQGHPAHVTVLAPANAIFATRAINAARLAYRTDADVHTDVLEHIANLNRQNAWRYWAAVAEVNGWDPHRPPSGSPNAPAP